MTEMNETNPSTVLPGQERYVAPLDETPLKAVDSMDESAPASNMWADAWRTLRKNPLFIISGLLIIFIVFVALFPSVLTKQNPNYCTLDNSLEPASAGHPFGFDLQGCDVYSRVVYGTRTSCFVAKDLSRQTIDAIGEEADLACGIVRYTLAFWNEPPQHMVVALICAFLE